MYYYFVNKETILKIMISNIIEIRFGKKDIPVTETRGRPMKKVDLDHVYNMFPSFGEISNTFAAGYVDPYSYKLKKDTDKCGVVEILNGGYGIVLTDGFVHRSSDEYIPSNFIEKYNLKDGDTITFKSKRVDKANIVASISEINGVDSSLISNRVDFKSLKPSYPKSKFDLSGESGIALISLICPIGKGSCGLIVGGQKSGKSSLLLSIAKTIKSKNSETFVSPIFVSKSVQEIEKVKLQENLASVYTLINFNCQDTIRSISLGINRAMRHAELGKDVVILIDDINSCYNNYVELLMKHGKDKSHAMAWMRSIFALGGKLSNGGSLSIIGAIDDSTPEGVQLKDELNQVVNFKIVFDEKLLSLRMFPSISIGETLSNISEQLLNDKELALSSEIRTKNLTITDPELKIEFFKKILKAKTIDEIK